MPKKQSKDPLERLDTPAWMTRALLHYMPWLKGKQILEPCAGANAITNVLRMSGCQVAAFDIEPRAPGVVQQDTLLPDFSMPDVDAVVTNTPFSKAADYWRRCHAEIYGAAPIAGQNLQAVALLVRLTWLEAAKDRNDIHDPNAIIVLPRGKFTGPGAINPETGQPYKGGDMATVCWAIWGTEDVLPERPIIRVRHAEKRQFVAAEHMAQRVAAVVAGPKDPAVAGSVEDAPAPETTEELDLDALFT